MPASTVHDASHVLKSALLRVTPVRLAVLQLLSGASAALDAQELFELLRNSFDRVTVYRTLSSLVDAGIAHKIDPGDRRFRFSLTSHEHCTPDHHAHDHPHLLCDRCGKVECMDDAEVTIKRTGKSPARGSAWRVKQQSVTVHGTCGSCVVAEPARKAPTAGSRRVARRRN